MKKTIFISLFIAFAVNAKIPTPLCSISTGSNFSQGDGSEANPYLVCNVSQFNRIGTDKLLSHHFRLGSDINFKNTQITVIGNQNEPFRGSLNGNDYALQNVTLPTLVSNNAIFSNAANAEFSNLIIDGIKNTNIPSRKVAGLVAVAVNSEIMNVSINNASLNAPDRSGILVGELRNSIIQNCHVSGELFNSFGADASGGLAGFVFDSQINNSSSNVSIFSKNDSVFGISAVGGLVGYLTSSSINDSYVIGNIDYTNAQGNRGPKQIGGIVGDINVNSSLNHVYFVGSFNINARDLGAAVGRIFGSDPSDSSGVIWNGDATEVTDSALGRSATTTEMSQRVFWLRQGFNDSVWDLVDGAYPVLKNNS